jgi:hypothetical protein
MIKDDKKSEREPHASWDVERSESPISKLSSGRAVEIASTIAEETAVKIREIFARNSADRS